MLVIITSIINAFYFLFIVLNRILKNSVFILFHKSKMTFIYKCFYMISSLSPLPDNNIEKTLHEGGKAHCRGIPKCYSGYGFQEALNLLNSHTARHFKPCTAHRIRKVPNDIE